MADKLKQKRLLRKLRQKQDLIDYLDGLGIVPKTSESPVVADESSTDSTPEDENIIEDELDAEKETTAETATAFDKSDTVERDNQIIEEIPDKKDNILAE
eukprot:13664191-Ditylum_brightwellii.AAC.1